MKKNALIAIYLLCSLMVNAQWRIGITGGATYNHYTIDNHYESNYWRCEGAWGGTFGFMGQYDFCDWFGIRADLNWTMKNHRQYGMNFYVKYETDDYGSISGDITNYIIYNCYMQLPIMATFCFGGKKIRGFFNTGIYGGYWLCSRNFELVEKRDQRYDYGFVGGGGLEYRFARNWALQPELRIYYSTQSTQKDYMKIKDPRYNTTLAIQCGLCYFL